jgi:chromosomal replication initiator protein
LRSSGLFAYKAHGVTQERSSVSFQGHQTWKEVLGVLRARVDATRFEKFLQPLRLISLDTTTVHLEAPDRLSLACVNEHLLGPIRETIATLVGPRQILVDLRTTPQGELFPTGRRRRNTAPGSELLARHTFDTFVVGASNQFAHAACLAVARQPGRHYNPLVVYGGVGLGKTHLASAIGNAILANDPEAKVGYLSSEQFTMDLIAAIRGDQMAGFKRSYRAVDVLIVDDVQFLAGRDRTQEEFFHTFNALHDVGRQIVLTSDKVPDDIPGLEERLRNRFQWGLIADIQPPDLETRVAILERKAELDGVALPEDAAMILAEQILSNVRSLEGALTRVAAHASLEGKQISVQLVHDLLSRGALGRHGPVTFDDIAQAVCERYGLTVQQLLSRRRTQHVAVPRQVAMYLCRRLMEVSYPHIGDLFGRDHTTALHGVRTISSRLKRDPGLQATVDTIEQRLNQK